MLFVLDSYISFYFMKHSDVHSSLFCRTEIEWFPGKCLTKKVLKKKPKKGSKNAKTITKIESCESFFNFFNPPQVPEDEDELDDDTVSEIYHFFTHNVLFLFFSRKRLLL